MTDKPDQKLARKRRLAAALRENLGQRKAQRRLRDAPRKDKEAAPEEYVDQSIAANSDSSCC